MAGLIPIMCAAGLSLMYSGEITSLNHLQIGHERAFLQELPNNGFLIQNRPELWEMGIKLDNSQSISMGGGIVWFTQMGSLQWTKGQTLTVHITACADNGRLSALERWNAFAPAMR